MSRFDNFVRLVQTEAIYACLSRSDHEVRPSAIMSVALQCPTQSLAVKTEGLRFQAQELVDWFFGGPDPDWMPESLMYEEVEEIIEEFVDEIDPDDDDYEYEIIEYVEDED